VCTSVIINMSLVLLNSDGGDMSCNVFIRVTFLYREMY
jgi:hypothetical protein